MQSNREIIQQALEALLHMCNTTKAQNDYNAKIVDKALVALEAALAQPEQEPFKPDWVSYRQGVVDGAAQPEQEEPLPLVDIGVDVTPEGTHVVACYNRPDAVQEMFYSQFHPLTKPEQSKYSDIVSGGGLDPRNKFDAKPEPKSISTNEHLCAMLRQVHDVLACTALPMKRPWVGLTGLELNHIFAANVGYPERMCRAIEAKLKEKNCG